MLGFELERKELIKFEFKKSTPTPEIEAAASGLQKITAGKPCEITAASGVGGVSVAAVPGETPAHSNILKTFDPNNIVMMPELTDSDSNRRKIFNMFEIELSRLTSVDPYIISKISKV